MALAAGCDPFSLGDFDLGGDWCWSLGFEPTFENTEGLLSHEGKAKLSGVCAGDSCETANRIPTGTSHVTLYLNASEDAFVVLESLTPNILTVETLQTSTSCVDDESTDTPFTEQNQRLNALAAGQAELSVMVNGYEIDRFTLEVAEPVAMGILVDGEPVNPDEPLSVGIVRKGHWGHELSYVFLDAAGNLLSPAGAVEWQVEDRAVAELRTQGEDGNYVTSDMFTGYAVELDTDATGETTVHARGKSLEASLRILVHGDEPGVITLPR